MKSSGLRSRLAALVTAGIICVCLLSLSSATAWAKVGVITEFALPTASSAPTGITAGPDGNLWFAELGGNKIGRIPRDAQRDGESAENEPTKEHEQGVRPRRITGKRETHTG